MSDQYISESMLDMFIFETTQLIEQLEQAILNSEKENDYTKAIINEIFRVMHTIKGSSAMMDFNNISFLAHSIEDLFFFIRENRPEKLDYSILSDLVLAGADFIKTEIEKVKSGNDASGDSSTLINNIRKFLTSVRYVNSSSVKKRYRAVIRFQEGCQMENVRAYGVVYKLKDVADEIHYTPQDIDDESSEETIRRDGFTLYISTCHSYQEIYELLMDTVFLQEAELIELNKDEEDKCLPQAIILEGPIDEMGESQGEDLKDKDEKELQTGSIQHSMISVSVAKLDKLMDLVGEMVMAEAMVTQNPDLQGLTLDNFYKAAWQLRKITSELQDMVMAIRMVPLSATFHKMHRIVRDMSKKLDKETVLKIIGEDTEVDKNIIQHISDPLMHLVRNAIDHGIEAAEDRQAKGKPKAATITLEAKNAGSDVVVLVRDDGGGLNKDKILERAKEHGLLSKSENFMTDKEIYNLIFLPGFSTREKVTEFSGRGVGMDVVAKNIETVGGSVSVDSIKGEGTVITLKIPLTLAIIDGMNIRVGNARYTIPIISIKESFRPKESQVITEPDGREIIMVRGQCFPILPLHKRYNVNTHIASFEEGIMIMVESQGNTLCLFADELLGEQQVVVKGLPDYIRNMKRTRGLAGCTLLGDGSISLILDIGQLINL